MASCYLLHSSTNTAPTSNLAACALFCPFLLLVQNAFYEPTAAEVRRQGNLWVIGFVVMAGGAVTGHLLLAYGFATAGERMTRRLRETAFEAVSSVSYCIAALATMSVVALQLCTLYSLGHNSLSALNCCSYSATLTHCVSLAVIACCCLTLNFTTADPAPRHWLV